MASSVAVSRPGVTGVSRLGVAIAVTGVGVRATLLAAGDDGGGGGLTCCEVLGVVVWPTVEVVVWPMLAVVESEVCGAAFMIGRAMLGFVDSKTMPGLVVWGTGNGITRGLNGVAERAVRSSSISKVSFR